ncbi:MAG: HoxN/HupN/NixA family nickel/cobalt transporter [Pseudomonadota bacterium]
MIFSDENRGVRAKIVGIYLVLGGANLLAWIWALTAFNGRPVLLGTAVLAYSFGLRHALDPDHIAAIDNVTRKLMQEGKRPVTVGFWFSLGHSTVVVLASLAIALTASTLQDSFAALREVAGLVATGVSVAFLFAVAIMNVFILGAIYRAFREVRRSGRFEEEPLETFLSRRGLLGRLFRPLFRLTAKSWHMYPLGFLFGLGFDTATEIALLGISGTEASRGLSVWSIMVFPALFTAGMSLVDTSDNIMMLGAYGWAFVKPIRKLYYNLTITLVSVLIALVIGSIEALGLIGEKLGFDGAFWSLVTALNQNFGSLGYLIVGIFGVSWLLSMLVYKIKRYDDVEAAPELTAPSCRHKTMPPSALGTALA